MSNLAFSLAFCRLKQTNRNCTISTFNLTNPYFMFPFVLRNFLGENDWPPFRLWTDEYLAEKLAKGQCLTVRIGEKTHFRGQVLHEHQCARHTFANCAAMLRWMRSEGHSDEGSELPSPSSSICPNPSTHWAYLDYRDVLELLEQDEAERVDWTLLGVIPPAVEAAEKGEHWRDSTVWIGTPGAYTPCHFDTYGFNLHAQLRGHKRWLLFPPTTDNDDDTHNQQRLWPSRLPYEESSVFSALDIVGGDQRMDPDMSVWPLTVGPGDLLFVPPKWWHSVQCVKVKGENASDSEDDNSGCAAEACISVNKWFPAPGDGRESAKEALLKFMMDLFMGSGLLNAEEHLCPMECNSMESSDLDELAKLVEVRLENAAVNNEKNHRSMVGVLDGSAAAKRPKFSSDSPNPSTGEGGNQLNFFYTKFSSHPKKERIEPIKWKQWREKCEFEDECPLNILQGEKEDNLMRNSLKMELLDALGSSEVLDALLQVLLMRRGERDGPKAE